MNRIIETRRRIDRGEVDTPEAIADVAKRLERDIERHNAWAGMRGPCDDPDCDWRTMDDGD